MPPVETPEAPGFTLASFERPGNPPEFSPKDQAALGGEPAPEPVVEKRKPPETPDVEVPKTPETPEPDTTPRPDGEPTDLLDALKRQPTRAADEAKVAAEKKTADDAAAAEKLKTEAGRPATDQRDADLKVEVGPHVQPKTRKIIEGYEGKTRAARDERDAAIARAAELEKRALAAEEKAKNNPPPKELEDKLKSYEERIRELDITQDPALKTKYDAKIAANNKSIVGVLTANLAVLKEQGFGMVKKAGSEEFVEVPGAMDKLVASGLNLKTLAPFCKVLEDAGLVDEAEAVREALRENHRTARDKQAEIESWKGNHATRLKERETATKQQQEETQRAYTVETDAQIRSDREALAKDFPFVNPPPAPLATDTPATAKAKQDALDQFNAETKQIETSVKAFNPAGVAPEKMPEFVGRFNAAAISSVILRTQVIPRLKHDLAAKAARIAELEKEISSFRAAGRISRAHSTAPSTDTENNGQSAPKTLEQAFMQRRPGDAEG